MIRVYGIKNCDSVKKARKWLLTHNLDYQFIDLREDGIDNNTLDFWIKQVGWEVLLNKRGTTWRNLDTDQQQSVNQTNVADLLLANPTLIKRPVLDVDGIISVGFSTESYDQIFNQ